LPRTPTPPPFPYTTLFRSSDHLGCELGRAPRLRCAHLVPLIRIVDEFGEAAGETVTIARVDEALLQRAGGGGVPVVVAREHGARSEEHTSELQSRFDLVCR